MAQIKYNLGNVNNNGNNYSTDEQVIGTWIDGKPIYRKVFIIENTTTSETDIDVSSLNIENVIDISGIAYNDSIQLPINFYNESGYNSCYYSKHISSIKYKISHGNNARIIIEYTKTTD